MTDVLRIRSNLPLAINAAELISDEFKDKPGLAPTPRTLVIKPGMNELPAADAEVYRKWAKGSPNFIADADAVKAGAADGLIYEVSGDEPDEEYGFEPALARATSGDNASLAAQGSTVKDGGPVKAADMAQMSTTAVPAASATAAPLAGPSAAKPAAPTAPAK